LNNNNTLGGSFKENTNKIYDKYNDAIEWLERLGLPAKNSRFGNYKKIFDNYSSKVKSSIEITSFKSDLNPFLNAHLEISEIIRIYDTLSDRDHSEFAEQLKKITSGQVYRDSLNHDESRDFSFELAMAARFINGGYEVQLNDLADIVVIKEGNPKIFVECKRVTSLKRVKANVKKANEQLKKRMADDKSKLCRGLVALNVSALINPKNITTVVDDVNQLQEMLNVLLSDFCYKNEINFSAKKSNKCLGVFTEATLAGYEIKGRVQNIIIGRGAQLLRYEHSTSDIQLIDEIGSKVSNQKVMAT
jgi:hypothetical protein